MKIKKILNGEDLWFMSDLHYNHENIIRHSRRPFETLAEMNAWIEGELSLLPDGATLFDLGDLFWKTDEATMGKVMSIPHFGQFHKVLGNHDKESIYEKSCVARSCSTVGDIVDIRVQWGEKIIPVALSHYPMVSWNNKARGAFMIHGHTHGNIDDYNDSSPDLRVDIGMDGRLARGIGHILIPFRAIYEHMLGKTKGETNFMGYVQEVRNNL